MRDAVAVVIGTLGESFGVLLFDSVADRDRFVALGTAAQGGDLPAVTELGGEIGMPAHAGLSFDPIDEIPATMREEHETHRWALADEEAFPSLLLFGDGPRRALADGPRPRARRGARPGGRVGRDRRGRVRRRMARR